MLSASRPRTAAAPRWKVQSEIKSTAEMAARASAIFRTRSPLGSVSLPLDTPSQEQRRVVSPTGRSVQGRRPAIWASGKRAVADYIGAAGGREGCLQQRSREESRHPKSIVSPQYARSLRPKTHRLMKDNHATVNHNTQESPVNCPTRKKCHRDKAARCIDVARWMSPVQRGHRPSAHESTTKLVLHALRNRLPPPMRERSNIPLSCCAEGPE